MAKSSVRTHPWIRGMDRHFLTGLLTCTNGAVAAAKGYGWSVTYVEEGVYTLTPSEPLREIIGMTFGVQSDDGTGGTTVVMDPDSTGSEITIRSYGRDGDGVNVAADVIGKLYFCIEHRETSAEPR